MVNENKTTLNFYSISSNFNDVLLKLCNKIVKTEENLYVNFDKFFRQLCVFVTIMDAMLIC